MGELHDLTALEQGRAVRAGEVSPVELARHYLERTDRLGPAAGAFTTVTAELALVAAGVAEQRVRDAAPGEDLGPLFGVVVPVKDLTQVAGVRTTFGSRAFADFVGEVDDHVVTLLRAAGTVLTGLTTAPEFGLPCYTEPDPEVAAPARTPYDRARTAGGSSGGAAVAVAAGLAPVALGNDGGGSVRIPASCCGLVGLKTSRGRISNGPVGGDVAGLACHGPLARRVADAAALLDVLARPMPGDPHWAPPLPAGETFLGWAGRDPGRCRVARFATPVIAEVALDPECLRAYEAAAALLADLGHDVVDVDAPAGPEVAREFELVWTTLAAGAPVPPGREHLLQPLTRYLRERGRAVGGPAFAAAVTGMRNLARRVLTAWEPYDAVLTPTLAAPPVPPEALRDDADPAAGFAAQKAFTPYTAFYNVTGQPAVSLPVHRTPAAPGRPSLPVGVMLAGRPAGEGPLLALAAQLEAACAGGGRAWADWHPPCW